MAVTPLPDEMNELLESDKEIERIAADKKRPRSLAEKIFDFIDYYVIGAGATAVVSVLIVDKFVNGSWNKPFKSAANKLSGSWYKHKTDPLESAESFLGGVTFGFGGLMLMIPIKFLEDHKTQTVEKIQHILAGIRGLFGHKQTEQEKEANKKDLKIIEKAPRQTWKSILIGRALGTASNYALLGFFPSTKPWWEGKGNELVAKLFHKEKSGFMDSQGKYLKNVDRSRFFQHSSNWITEVVLSLICATVLYVSSKAYSAFKYRKSHAQATVAKNIAARNKIGEVTDVENASQRSTPPPEKLWTSAIQPKSEEIPAKSGSYRDSVETRREDSAAPAGVAAIA